MKSWGRLVVAGLLAVWIASGISVGCSHGMRP